MPLSDKNKERVQILDDSKNSSDKSILLKNVTWADSGKYLCKLSITTEDNGSCRKNGSESLLIVYGKYKLWDFFWCLQHIAVKGKSNVITERERFERILLNFIIKKTGIKFWFVRRIKKRRGTGIRFRVKIIDPGSLLGYTRFIRQGKSLNMLHL